MTMRSLVLALVIALGLTAGSTATGSAAPAARSVATAEIYTHCDWAFTTADCRTYLDRAMTRTAWAKAKPYMSTPVKAIKSANTVCKRTRSYGAVMCYAAFAVGYAALKEIRLATRQSACWAFRYTVAPPRAYFRYSYITDTSRCRD